MNKVKNIVTIQRDLAFFIGFVETHGRASLHYSRKLNLAEKLQKEN